ncbi:hypothetical protein D3C87_406320 [compost metagenome]
MKKEWAVYLDKFIDDLKSIQPKWTCGRNYQKSQLKSLSDSRTVIYYANIEELLQYTDIGELSLGELFDGLGNNDVKIAQIICLWDHGIYLDPPSIFFSTTFEKVLFSDGRHRTKAAYLLGQKQLPVSIPEQDIIFIKRLFQISKRPFDTKLTP